MLNSTVTQPPTLTLHPGELNVGDRIAAGFLPSGDPAEVLFTTPYRLHERDAYVLVVSRFGDGVAEADHFLADASIPVEALADDGFGYSREAEDDPAPVSPARVPLHTGSVVDGDALVVDGIEPKCTPECDALQERAIADRTGLDRFWHADDCPVPVHHFAQRGFTACEQDTADLPKAHGYGQAIDAVTCKACLDRIPF